MTMAIDVLRGRVAIVTGGSKGLGLAMAGGLLRAGASIVVAARNGEAAEAAAVGLRALGGEAMSAACDVRLESDVDALVEGTVKRFGRLDIVVNNAGINIRKPSREEVAGVAVFLASGASDFITGAAIPVDAGYSVLG